MNRSLSAFLTTLLLTLPACSSSEPHVPPGPPIIHFQKTEIDLGRIPIRPEGYEVPFNFTNRGLSTLKISSLVKSCSCADVRLTDNKFPITRSGKVILKIAPTLAEERSATVEVHSNDPDHPVTTLVLKWRAVAPLELDPLSVNFGLLRPDETKSLPIKIDRNRSDPSTDVLIDLDEEIFESQPVITKIIASPSDQLKLPDLPTSAAPLPFDLKLLNLQLTAGKESGRFNGTVTLYMKDAWRESFSIPVSWQVRDRIESIPPRFFAGVVTPGSLVSATLTINAEQGQNLEIISLAPETPLEDWAFSTRQIDAHSIRCDLSFKSPSKSGVFRNTLALNTSKPFTHQITIPVSGLVKSSSDSPGTTPP